MRYFENTMSMDSRCVFCNGKSKEIVSYHIFGVFETIWGAMSLCSTHYARYQKLSKRQKEILVTRHEWLEGTK